MVDNRGTCDSVSCETRRCGRRAGEPARIAELAMDTADVFGRELRRLRRAWPLTQAALAGQAGCALDTIKKIDSAVASRRAR